MYYRIRWDRSFSPEAFVIGYEERFSGSAEVALADFVPDGDIPWHRVVYIRGPNGIVWDRRERIDLVFGSGRTVALRDLPPVPTSAVVVVPPRALWPTIQALRACHDRHYLRWMPHVTLIHGFVEESHHPRAAEVAARSLDGVAPFAVTLDAPACMHHGRSSTVYLTARADPPGALDALRARLEALFPLCREQSARGFGPHLTIGQAPGQAALLLDRVESDWSPASFEVDEVHLVNRAVDGPFVPTHVVPLGRAVGREPSRLAKAVENEVRPLSPQAKVRREAALVQLETACREIDATATCHVTGSVFIGVDDEQSDLDVLCATGSDIDREVFFSRLVRVLGRSGRLDRARPVHDAIVPVLEIGIDGVDIDLSHARCPEGVLPSDIHRLPLSMLRRLDPASRRTVLGLTDNLAIVGAATKGAGRAAFAALTRAVRAWARSREVFSQAYGFLGGFTWALLAAWVCRERRAGTEPSEEQLLAGFFDRLSRWDWMLPVGLSSAARQYRPAGERDRMPIVTSAKPVMNAARSVTVSTFAVLKAEIERARRISVQCLAGKDVWGSLFDGADLSVPQGAWIAFEVSARDEAGREACRGWLRQHVLSLILDVESEHGLVVRPFPTGPSVGLGGRFTPSLEQDLSATLGAFVERFERWPARPAGASLSVVVRRSPSRSAAPVSGSTTSR